MTEDYKKNLIDYVIGDLQISVPEEVDFNIKNINGINYTSSIWTDFLQNYYASPTVLNPTFTIVGILEDENYEIFIMYCNYQYTDTNNVEHNKRVFIYLDKYGNPQSIKESDYDGAFRFLKYDSDNNRIYGIASKRDGYYFVYLNNLFVLDEDAPVQIKYAYKITSSIPLLFVKDMVKNPNDSSYLIVNYISQVLSLKINTGSSNEEKVWQKQNPTSNPYTFKGWVAWFDIDNNPHFKMICHTFKSGESYKVYALIQDNGDNFSYTELSFGTTMSYLTSEYGSFVSIDSNNIYFYAVNNIKENNIDKYQGYILKYDGTTTLKQIYQSPLIEDKMDGGLGTSGNQIMINMVKDYDNTVYFIKTIINYDEDKTDVSVANLGSKSTLSETDWTTIGTYNYINTLNIFDNKAFVRRNYNIMNIYFFTNQFITYTSTLPISTKHVGFSLNIQCLDPINGYNGNPYVDNNVLSPLYSNLYSNGSLIFSRNLYNISKQNNMTMASVEIPNTYLNETSITRNDLISETNLQMINDNKQWTKNIYEVVDLSFLNTISVIDEDNDIEYLASAIKINNAITDGTNTDYQNTPCTKYRINYTDNTTSVSSLVWTSIDDLHKETTITIYVDKAISSIDLISADETTIYLTIPLQVIVGKTYSITQKVRIGG